MAIISNAMSMKRKNILNDFDRKVALVTKTIVKTLSSIEGRRVQPWNFGLMKDGSICGVIKVDEIEKSELFSLKEMVNGGKFRIFLACNDICYEIDDVIKKHSGYSAVLLKEKINNEISKFRMDLIRL
jgi:hypothetical protein